MTPTAQQARPITVLLVEDNLGDVLLLREMFTECKVPVNLKWVRDGKEALDFLNRKPPYESALYPELILLDLNMPRKGGFEVLEVVKSDPFWSRIPVLVLTCSASEADIRRAYDAKANFYLVKSTDLEQSFELVKYVEEYWLRHLRFHPG